MTVNLPQWYNSPARPTRIPKRRPGNAKITVIVPTRNEADNLLPVLVCARPHADELLVIDGNSTDGTRDIATACAARPRRFAILGLLLGIAALSKLSALALIGLAGLTVLGLAWHTRSWRVILDTMLWIGIPTARIAGWWFARNIVPYDDLLAWNLWEANILLCVAPATAQTIFGELGSLFQSYWGLFGGRNHRGHA